ncbi:MAG: outer-membrane lipoprotein carrier protein LolA [Bacteroidales bacterium]|nr:outer-membrane lipoprotein carrier protein LolA [Bacteroidales bacterium]
MKILLFLFFANIPGSAFSQGQNDQQAIKILDSFASNASKAPSISMVFRMISADLTDNSSDTLNGSIILSKDKYRLNLGENSVWYNGETIWNYLTAEKEVTITKPDKKDHSFQNRPSEIFTMYKSGYKSRLIEEKTDTYLVDLYPEDLKSDLVRVRLTISKTNLALINLEYKRRDGMVITLMITEYDLRQKPDADTFVFKADKYKGVDINDMR